MSADRLAVISDVHGNARALEAVLDDVRHRSIRRIVHLGDGLYGPFDPRPAAEMLRDLVNVSGNEDRILVEGAAGASVSRAAQFTLARLSQGDIDWLAALPRIVRWEKVAMFHGTPASDTVYLLTEPSGGRLAPRRAEDVERRIDGIDVPLVLCGHDHTPSIVRLPGGCTVVDPGSVGCPAYRDDAPGPHVVEAGSPHARYAVIEWDHGDRLHIQHVQVSYDWTAAAAEAETNGFPDWAYGTLHGLVAPG